MKPLRKERISSFLRAEIARIIQRELKDPRIGFVSVMDVEPTEDLKEAKVRVSVMGTPSQQRTAVRGLQSASGFIQTHLRDVCRFRNIPSLRFILDESIQRSMDMDALIRQARDEDEAAARARSDGE